VIRAQQQSLDELTTDDWWQDVTLPMLETMRHRIRGLVQLIEKTKRGIVYTDFEDQLGNLALTSLKAVPLGTDRSRFEAKIRTYLRSHEDHLAVQKIRRNLPVTPTDLSELERVFLDAGFGTEEDIARMRQEPGGMGLFLRSLTGLERAAAAAAFDAFQAGRTLSADQLHFLDLVIDYLARNGTVEVDVLYEHPFTSHAPRGPEDIFPEPDVDQGHPHPRPASHRTSTPNDHPSAASAPATATVATIGGSTPDTAATRTTPWTAATILREYRGGSGVASQGNSRAAATNP
jgi:type I restriction enzyme R subunit